MWKYRKLWDVPCNSAKVGHKIERTTASMEIDALHQLLESPSIALYVHKIWRTIHRGELAYCKCDYQVPALEVRSPFGTHIVMHPIHFEGMCNSCRFFDPKLQPESLICKWYTNGEKYEQQ